MSYSPCTHLPRVTCSAHYLPLIVVVGERVTDPIVQHCIGPKQPVQSPMLRRKEGDSTATRRLPHVNTMRLCVYTEEETGISTPSTSGCSCLPVFTLSISSSLCILLFIEVAERRNNELIVTNYTHRVTSSALVLGTRQGLAMDDSR